MSRFQFSMASELLPWQPRYATAESMSVDAMSEQRRRNFRERAYIATESTSVSALSEQQWDQRSRDLLELRRLKKNWNGFGADAPDPRVVDKAISYLTRLRLESEVAPDRVVLAPDGAVIIEWQSEAERVEVEINYSSQVEWMMSRKGVPAKHWNQELLSAEETLDRDSNWETETDSVAGGAASVYVR